MEGPRSRVSHKGLRSLVLPIGPESRVPDEGSQVEGPESWAPCMGSMSRVPGLRSHYCGMPFYDVVQTSSEISPSLRLLLKCVFDTDVKTVDQYYHHDGEQLDFYQKVLHIKTLAEKRRIFL